MTKQRQAKVTYIKLQPASQYQVDQLALAQSQTVEAVEQLSQRYEQLSLQEKRRVNAYLRNVYEIVGLEPGDRLEEGQNYFQSFQYLFTTVNDHTIRIGRVEQLLEKVFAMLSTQSDTVTVTKSESLPEKQISTHEPLEMWVDAEGNLIDSGSESDSDMSWGEKSDSSPHRSYGEIRQLRGIYPGLKVKEFCAKFEISEQAFYRAMRKGK